ncbi:MAG: Murein DD-endopeptidase MepM [bacterium ADurb.Bin212]|nr:MAG: Murein DD-endopeptidase MepM [bacterium ADurb.Bin212]
MSAQAIKIIGTAFSMKKEIKYIFFTLLAIIMVPIFAVMILTQAGIDLVSDALATFDPQNLIIDIHDPLTGEVVDHVDQSVAWPITGAVTLEYRERSPYQPFHTGIDIAGPIGDPIIAFMDGEVVYADTINWGFGRHVKISSGRYITSVYAHLDTIDQNIKVGDTIPAGTIIGTRGNTGWSTGPHLHFQTNIFGIPVNPRTFLQGNP